MATALSSEAAHLPAQNDPVESKVAATYSRAVLLDQLTQLLIGVLLPQLHAWDHRLEI